MDISFERLISLFLTKLKYMILFAVIAALATFVVCNNFIEKKYTSAATLAISANSENSQNNNNNELNAAIKAVDNYIKALATDTFFANVAERVNEELDTDFTARQLKSNSGFSPSSADTSSFFNITYTTTNPDQAHEILTIITDEAVKYAADNEKLFPQELAISEKPTYSKSPSSPHTRNNTVYAFIIAFVVTLCFFYFKEIFDNRIKNVRDISGEYDVYILGVVPDYIPAKKKKSKSYHSYANSYAKEETKNG